MNVKETIDLLSKLDPEKKVLLLDGEDFEPMNGIAIQMEDSDLEGDSIILCTKDMQLSFMD